MSIFFSLQKEGLKPPLKFCCIHLFQITHEKKIEHDCLIGILVKLTANLQCDICYKQATSLL